MSLAINPRLLVLIASALAAASFITMPRASSAEGRPRDTAERVRALLAERCYQCHGSNGVARKNVDVSNHARLISSKIVVPGDADSTLLKVVESGAMPFGGPELPKAEKEMLRSWVIGGAPSWDAFDKEGSPRSFLSESAILALIRDDLLSARDRARPYLRYFLITHLHNAGAPAAELESYRIGLAKLVNSLSWHREITPPAPIDPAKTIFRIDLRDYNWTTETWNTILAAYRYGLRTRDAQIITRLSGAALPYVRADWFVANASVPPLYHRLLALPRTVAEMERILSVDAARNLEEEKNVARAGIRNSGVSHNNRVLERHTSAHGAYWKSFDFRSNLDDQNIFKDPLRLNAAGGEIIFNLPNGLQGYLLIDARGNRIDRAPIDIVADRNNPDDPVIQNGRSCMGCHYAGMQSFKDDVRAVIKGMTIGFFDRNKALALYPAQETLDSLIEKDRARFLAALKQAGVEAGTSAASEPINALSRRFAAEISVRQAAAEAGLEVEEFQARVKSSARLIALGFGQLVVAGGGFKRDGWEKHFGDLASELQLGSYEPGQEFLSRKALALQAAAPTVRVAGGSFNPALARSAMTSNDPAEIMRVARTIFIWSNTIFLSSEKLARELQKRSEFQALGLVIVTDPRVADIRVELNRPPLTFIYEFAATNPQTSLLLTSGKVTAWDGNFAAPKIAKELLKQVQAARSKG